MIEPHVHEAHTAQKISEDWRFQHIKIVANPTKKMIEDYSRYAGTLPYIDGIIGSGEDVGAFKPSPKVFRRN